MPNGRKRRVEIHTTWISGQALTHTEGDFSMPILEKRMPAIQVEGMKRVSVTLLPAGTTYEVIEPHTDTNGLSWLKITVNEQTYLIGVPLTEAHSSVRPSGGETK